MSTYDRAYYLKNRERLIARRKANYYKNHATNREKHRAYNRRVRQQTLDAYGNICTCCGEKEYEFLTFDHINGGGAKHRKSMGTNSKIEIWLRKNNYPAGFQILCWNCNSAKGLYEKCPHKKND